MRAPWRMATHARRTSHTRQGYGRPCAACNLSAVHPRTADFSGPLKPLPCPCPRPTPRQGWGSSLALRLRRALAALPQHRAPRQTPCRSPRQREALQVSRARRRCRCWRGVLLRALPLPARVRALASPAAGHAVGQGAPATSAENAQPAAAVGQHEQGRAAEQARPPSKALPRPSQGARPGAAPRASLPPRPISVRYSP